MKAVPKVNIDGLYLEDALVDDAFSGVVPFYAEIVPLLPDQDGVDQVVEVSEVEQPGETPKPVITGYIVSILVTPGLYRPRFDINTWKAYRVAVDAALTEYQQTYDEWAVLPEDERGDMPILESLPAPALWIEGLTPEEIEELTKPQPVEPNEMDRLGNEMVMWELEALELRQQNEAQGAQIVGLELRLLSLENS